MSNEGSERPILVMESGFDMSALFLTVCVGPEVKAGPIVTVVWSRL